MARRTFWVDRLYNDTAINDAAENLDLLTNVPQHGRDGMTLLRTITQLEWTPATPHAVSGLVRVDYGIGLCQEEAFSAGALPDVDAQEDHPPAGWVIRGSTMVMDETTLAVRNYRGAHHDIRAMRKLDADTTLYLQYHNGLIEGTAFTIRLNGLVRLLLALP